jgi:hypothetical protein
MMNKVIENGQVAVLYSPGWGAGWYTWNKNEALLFDPILVELVKLKNDYSGDDVSPIVNRIIKRAEEIEPGGYFGGAVDLDIYWTPEGTQFFMEEYDGAESISTRDNTKWMIA